MTSDQKDLPPASSSIITDATDPPLSENQTHLLKTASLLETTRSLRAEHEASLLFALSLLSNNVTDSGSTAGLSSEAAQALPASVRDAWVALIQNADYSHTFSEPVDESITKTQTTHNSTVKTEYALPQTRGQLIKALFTGALSVSFERAAELAKILQHNEKDHAALAIETLRSVAASQEQQQEESNSQSAPAWMMQTFYHRVGEIREYHAKHAGTSSSSTSSLQPLENYNALIMSTNTNPTEDSTMNILPPPFKKLKRVGNPMADGYDLYSLIDTHLQKIQLGDWFSPEEVFGKYFDFNSIYQSIILSSDLNGLLLSAIYPNAKHLGTKISYLDFLNFLLEPNFMTLLPEAQKLLHRKKYIRFLCAMKEYLMTYLHRVSPLLDIEADVISPALSDFIQEWSRNGGIVSGWECKPAEIIWASTIRATHDIHAKSENTENLYPSDGHLNESTTIIPPNIGIDLTQYLSADDLSKAIDADTLKVELSRLGLKCGGTPLERAKRLWLTKNTPLHQLPAKLFVKPPTKKSSSSTDTDALTLDSFHIDSSSSINETNQSTDIHSGYHVPNSFLQNSRRIDIAYLETIIMALIDQVRPILDATARRAERRQTQTVGERERELMDEILGTASKLDKGKKKDKSGDNDDDDEDEEEPIYNPKGVPLG